MKISEKCIQVEFANLKKASKLLCANDIYMQSMHPLERSLKMKTQLPISKEEYFNFICNNILEWNEDEKEILENISQLLSSMLINRHICLNEKIIYIKTTGYEEWNCAYTRSNAIVLPEKKLKAYNEPNALLRLIAHEFFHVLTRKYSKLRTSLYNIIGFHLIEPGELTLPDIVRRKMLTNPDSPSNKYFIIVQSKVKSIKVIPVMFLNDSVNNVNSTEDILKSLKARFLIIERIDNTWEVEFYNGKPHYIEIDQASGLYEQIGINSDSIIEPDEILAEYFVNLISNQQQIVNQNIIFEMNSVLSKYEFFMKSTSNYE